MIVWYENRMYRSSLTWYELDNYKRTQPRKKVKITSVYGNQTIEVEVKDLDDYSITRNLNCFL